MRCCCLNYANVMIAVGVENAQQMKSRIVPERSKFFFICLDKGRKSTHTAKGFYVLGGFIVETILGLFISFRRIETKPFIHAMATLFLPSRRWLSSALKCARTRTVHQHATALHTLVSFESEFSLLTRFPSRIVLVIHVRSGYDAYDSIINVSLHISIIWQTHNYWFAIFVELRCEKDGKSWKFPAVH